jgi:Tfp pilus assembly protein PilX
MQTSNERGMALVLTLFLMTALSALAGSLMFLSQTETYASMNYRMMSQSRYAAESGVQKASNFLLDSTKYTVPGGVGDPLSNYDRTVSPVKYNGQPVVISGTASVTSNYPIAAVQTAFNTAAHGTLAAGNTTLTYSAHATLLSMQVFESYGGGQAVVQTWRITGAGGLSGSPNGTVEVSAVTETPKVPASSYAAFATDTTCGALSFSGDTTTNSYDSTSVTGATTPTMSSTGGNVGTNGNLSIGGSVEVNGNLYTPRTGVGNCTSGAVTALTESGHAEVTGSVVQLPTTVSYPTPPIPAPSPLPAAGPINSATGACALLGLTIGTTCFESGSNITINGLGSTLSLPSVTLGSSTHIILVASSPSAQYNFNSITLAGGSSVGISATGPTQNVLVNVVGKNPDNSNIATPIDFVGGTFASVTGCATCSNYDASMLQFIYGGTGEIKLTGNSGAAATIYAPNATVELSGNIDLYGSVLAKRMYNTGNAPIHYDRRLGRDFYVAGHPMASDFTWKRY